MQYKFNPINGEEIETREVAAANFIAMIQACPDLYLYALEMMLYKLLEDRELDNDFKMAGYDLWRQLMALIVSKPEQ